ncbi:MAG TPA: cation-translocating P-type ATPase [Holophagaceae bacterium]|nr:cation-translocating P-type ATPase [Holophagaceae bacterium]
MNSWNCSSTGDVMETRTFPVEGMTCASCVRRVERALKKVPGVSEAAVNLALNEATVSYEGATPEGMAEALKGQGYTLRFDGAARVDEAARTGWRALFAWALAAPLLMGMVPGAPRLDWRLQAVLSGLSAFGAGSGFFVRAARQAVHLESSMDTLVALGAGASWLFAVAEALHGVHHLTFETAAALVAFLLLGKWLEARMKTRAASSLASLLKLAPATALRVEDGVEVEVAASDLHPGDRVRVKPGMAVPADGVVLHGQAEVEEALLTGEPLPVPRAAGDAVIAGALVHGGALEIEVRAAGRASWLARLADQVAEAQRSRAPMQDLADRVSAVFVPAILLVAALTLAAWWIHTGQLAEAWRPAVTTLVIACPCALGLATPVALSTALGTAARMGLLVREVGAFQRLAELTDLVFDKTGTLTEGRPSLVETHLMKDTDALRLAAALEQGSEHPLAKGLLRAAEGMALPSVSGFRAHPGGGVSGQVEGRELRLGSAAFLGLDFGTLPEEGTAVGLAEGDRLLALFRLADAIRSETPALLAGLKARGLKLHLFSGDRPEAVKAVAAELGLDEAKGGMSPEGKQAAIQALQAEGRRVGFIGDGINDAPALAQADAGLSLPGLEAAQASAPLNLMRGGFDPLRKGMDLAAKTRVVIAQNMVWAFGYNLVLVPLAAFGLLERFGGPMLAGAAMGLSSVTVVLNALRLRKVN